MSRDCCRLWELPVTGSAANRLLVQPFAAPGQLVALAYRELDRPTRGTWSRSALWGSAVAAATVGAGDLPHAAAAQADPPVPAALESGVGDAGHYDESRYSSGASSTKAASPHPLARLEPADPGWAVSSETADWQVRQLARCSSNSRRSAGDRSPQHVGCIPLGELGVAFIPGSLLSPGGPI
jgi:hypothetical protein